MSDRDCPTVCPWYDPFLCKIGMDYVLSTIHQFEQGGITRIWLRDDCFDVIGTLGYYHLLWGCPFVDYYRLVRWNVVQYEIGIEWHGRNGTSIEWERGLYSFTSFFVVLPNTSIKLNCSICWIEKGTRSYMSSIVNWSSNSPFNRMILPSISRKRTSIDRIGLSLECRCPPRCGCSQLRDRPWSSW